MEARDYHFTFWTDYTVCIAIGLYDVFSELSVLFALVSYAVALLSDVKLHLFCFCRTLFH